MGKDKKDDQRGDGKGTAPLKRSSRTTKETDQVDFPALSIPSGSGALSSAVDEDDLHEQMMECRSMDRPVTVSATRDISSDEESTYTHRKTKRRRVREGRELDLGNTGFVPRSPSPRVDSALVDATTLTEFKAWMSDEFLTMRGTLDHILTEVTRVGRRLGELEESHKLEQSRIRALQEKGLSQTGNPPPNPTTPMSAPPSTSQPCKPSTNPWEGGSGIL